MEFFSKRSVTKPDFFNKYSLMIIGVGETVFFIFLQILTYFLTHLYFFVINVSVCIICTL